MPQVSGRKTKLRVIAGTAKGTGLTLPDGVRPVPSRMKQAVFNMLRDRIEGATVLDLFAGSGSMGIEAASRGAKTVVFVEENRGIRAAIQGNIERARVENRSILLFADAYAVCEAMPAGISAFDIVFADPPYAQSEDEVSRQRLVEMLARLERNGALSPEVVVVLHARAAAVGVADLPPGLEAADCRRYGSGILLMCRFEIPSEKTFAAWKAP